MTKKEIIRIFTIQLQEEIEALISAAKATYEDATHEESKPENQYDTRAIEASYLAGAQAKRVGQIREILGQFQNLKFKTFTAADPLESTALVKVAIDGKINTLLLMPQGGGFTLRLEDKVIQIITPGSFLGEAIFGLKVGDEAEYEVGKQNHICKILGVE
jgi:hypothetical protein